MSAHFLNTLFSPSVKAAQSANGSRDMYATRDGAIEPDVLGANEIDFITSSDSFYVASVGAQGWPYIQHRGGLPGFVKVLDERTLGIADFRGNRQYVSVGNFADSDKAAFFFMDYPRRARLKLLGNVKVVALDDAPDLAAALRDTDYKARIERLLMIRVEAFDWNCSQHITPRYTLPQIEPSIAVLNKRIADLEAEVALLKSGTP